jgi:signal recognition particle subunit SRP19
MKEYEKHVLWLDYFNSEFKRTQGRRVPLSSATRSPTLEELDEACRRLNLRPVPQAAKYPGAPARQSGYVMVQKSKPKHALVLKVAKELAIVRGIAQKKIPSGRTGPKRAGGPAKV